MEPFKIVGTYEVWVKYEEIAMHFNELTLKFRLQALAGLAAILVFLSNDKVSKDPRLLCTGSLLLLVAWMGLACLDLFYYHRLLLGTSEALRELEKNAVMFGNTYIQFSKRLDEKMGRWGPRAPWIFHSAVVAILLVIAALAWGAT